MVREKKSQLKKNEINRPQVKSEKSRPLNRPVEQCARVVIAIIVSRPMAELTTPREHGSTQVGKKICSQWLGQQICGLVLARNVSEEESSRSDEFAHIEHPSLNVLHAGNVHGIG